MPNDMLSDTLTAALMDPAGIAARIPHQGRMCLLHGLQSWSAEQIVCTAISHHDPENPLLMGGVLWSACGIEYASQAMALHGVLSAEATAATASAAAAGAAATAAPRAGFLVSVRGVQMWLPQLHTVPGALRVAAYRLAGDARQASYRFELHSAAGALLVAGRASVILQAPLQAPLLAPPNLPG